MLGHVDNELMREWSHLESHDHELIKSIGGLNLVGTLGQFELSRTVDECFVQIQKQQFLMLFGGGLVYGRLYEHPLLLETLVFHLWQLGGVLQSSKAE